jgi:hypothetical protein
MTADSPSTVRQLRFTGIAGLLGACVMAAGDMLYYYQLDPMQSRDVTMRGVSDWRWLAGGATAPIAAWLYSLGSWHMYLTMQPAGKWLARCTFVSFAAVMVFYGVFHAAYAGLGTGGNLPRTEAYLRLLLQIVYVPAAIWTVLFIFTVLFCPTRYPRWIVLITPTLFYLVENMVTRLPGFSRALIGGGFNNLILLLFFTVSTVLTWNGGRRRT